MVTPYAGMDMKSCAEMISDASIADTTGMTFLIGSSSPWTMLCRTTKEVAVTNPISSLSATPATRSLAGGSITRFLG